MAEKVMMIALSPTMEDGSIVSWSMKEGDSVSSGDVLCEVETDKATMDYESTQEGTLLKIVKGEGSSAKVGETIAIIGEEGEDISDLEDDAQAGTGTESEKPGDDEASGKTSDGTGDQKKSKAKTDDARSAGKSDEAASREDRQSSSHGAATGQSGIVKASPLARKIASDKGIDLSQVSGSGPGGRVVKADVESFKGSSASAASPQTSSGVMVSAPGEDRTVQVSRMRATIAKRLAESKFGAPHFYLKLSVDMTGIMDARTRLNAELPEKVGLNAFIMKFAAEALKRHPSVNASWNGDTITEFASVDIGLAVEMKSGGLITPVVRNCGNKGIVQIDNELKDLIARARDGGLKPEEYSGATFSISNLGSFGIEEFTAIINPPGSAILALGTTTKTAVFDEYDDMKVVPVMKMTLSCDHRVVDGASGARFFSDLQKMMEDPARALY
ncbi:MAG: 2-oxo acid dehydrogenase subunit E2 [Spirochaetaceae bacterium]|nr:MAG: 2-oxo acid dehydrogenase subunit E2 [Spirochaetaceae bacterium]